MVLTTRSISWRTEVSRSGRAEVAAEVLGDDDVRGELAPEVGDLDVLLLEDALAGLVGDAGRPVLPGDLVVGMDARSGPAALEGQAACCRAVRVLAREAGAVGSGQMALCSGGGGGRRGPPRLGLGLGVGCHDRGHVGRCSCHLPHSSAWIASAVASLVCSCHQIPSRGCRESGGRAFGRRMRSAEGRCGRLG